MRLYHRLTRATFLQRPNRFIARCEVGGETVVCHVKNTGRCRELLLPGAAVWLEESDNPQRKTRYDLVCVENRGYTVNMDSQAPNLIFREWLASGGCLPGVRAIRPETRYGDSRFDFAYEREMALMNQKKLGVETVFLIADPALSYVSSSSVRELLEFGADVKGLVPDNILDLL